MLTITGLIVDEFTDLSGTTGDFTAALEYRYSDICTSFDHDASQNDFTGSAVISGGHAYVVVLTSTSSLVTEGSVGAVPPLTCTVYDAFFDTIASIGNCDLTGSLTPLPFVTDLNTDNPFTSLNIGIVMGGLSLLGSTALAGVFFASIEAYDATSNSFILGLERPFTVTRGGSCPV